jgi:hypothetical protein
LGAALQRLQGRISADDMRRMNYAVDGEKRDPSQVVRQFLSSMAKAPAGQAAEKRAEATSEAPGNLWVPQVRALPGR